jgi:hypothetical protein
VAEDVEEPCNACVACLPTVYSCSSGTTVWYHQRGESCAPLGDLCASPRHRHQSLDLEIDAAAGPVKKDGGGGCRRGVKGGGGAGGGGGGGGGGGCAAAGAASPPAYPAAFCCLAAFFFPNHRTLPVPRLNEGKQLMPRHAWNGPSVKTDGNGKGSKPGQPVCGGWCSKSA